MGKLLTLGDNFLCVVGGHFAQRSQCRLAVLNRLHIAAISRKNTSHKLAFSEYSVKCKNGADPFEVRTLSSYRVWRVLRRGGTISQRQATLWGRAGIVEGVDPGACVADQFSSFLFSMTFSAPFAAWISILRGFLLSGTSRFSSMLSNPFSIPALVTST